MLRGSFWMLPSLGLPVLLGLALPQVGFAPGIVYAVVNTLCFWVFIDGRRSTDRLARWSRGAACLALPLGFVLIFLSEGESPKDSIDPKDQAASLSVKPWM